MFTRSILDRLAERGAVLKAVDDRNGWTLYGHGAAEDFTALWYVPPNGCCAVRKEFYLAAVARTDPNFARAVAEKRRAAIRRRKKEAIRP